MAVGASLPMPASPTYLIIVDQLYVTLNVSLYNSGALLHISYKCNSIVTENEHIVLNIQLERYSIIAYHTSAVKSIALWYSGITCSKEIEDHQETVWEASLPK